MSRSRTLVKNTALIGVSRISLQFVLFFMLPVYTANLSTAEFGAVDLIVSYGGLLAPLVMLNLQQAVFRNLIESRNDDFSQKRIITNSLDIIMSVSVIAIAVLLGVGVLFDIPFAPVAALYFAAFIVSDLVLNIARGLGKTKAFAVTGLIQGGITVALNLLFLLVFNMGATGMLYGLAIGLIVPALFLASYLSLHKYFHVSSRSRAYKRELLDFSLPLLPHSISWWAFNASDRTIIAYALGLSSTGIYAVTTRFASIANSFSAIFYASWSETAVSSINDPDRDVFFSRVANIMIATFGLVSILIMSATPLVFPLLVDSSFREALLYLPLLSLGTILNTVVSFYSAIYIAKKLTKQVANTSMVAALISIVINLLLIWFIDLWAAAISTVLAYAAMALYRHFDMIKYVKITYNKKLLAVMSLLFIGCTCLFYMERTEASWIGVALSLVVALALLLTNRRSVLRLFGRI